MNDERLRVLLSNIYGSETARSTLPLLAVIMDRYRGMIPRPHHAALSERDAILITYPDQVQDAGRPTLESLRQFCGDHLKELINRIHVLPFFPWSSDDGFSVIEYRAVETQYGTWDDVRALAGDFRLMFDAVINHASAECSWFQGYLRDDPQYREYFIEVSGHPDLSQVVRPRALPLLTEFGGPVRARSMWTTFSRDQIDLNYHNPDVLLSVIDILLFYVSRGAELIRLDAVAYLWKEIGTSCIHLRQTHWIVQLIRAVLDGVAPHVRLVTETNVPNQENLSYFGDGSNEAQLVYNFPLPPLVLHALQTGDGSALTKWAASLRLPSERTTFLNFLASHDGIGLNPVRGILPDGEIQAMVDRVEASGGLISKKTNSDGTQAAYELNANYFDALNAGDTHARLHEQIARFLTAHAILLSLQGLPAIYFHSLFGSRGWPEGVQQTQNYRTINRQKLQRMELEQELDDRTSLRSMIFSGLSRLLAVRAANPCFAPQSPQRVLGTGGNVFALVRKSPDSAQAVMCIHNLRGKPERVTLDLSDTPLSSAKALHDLLGGSELRGQDSLPVTLEPYQTMWLEG